MGFFKRRSARAASDNFEVAGAAIALDAVKAEGATGPKGEAVPEMGDELIDSQDDLDLGVLEDASNEPSAVVPSPLVPSKDPASTRIPLEQHDFATTEDYLLAVVEYAANACPTKKEQAGAADDDDSYSKSSSELGRADNYPPSSFGHLDDDFKDDDAGAREQSFSGSSEMATATLKDLASPPGPDDELTLLRRLILGREIDGLEDIHDQLFDKRRFADALSQVVAEAVRLRARRDDQLVVALKTTVNQIVRSSVRNNPSELADNLFPVMGPAIRRSIAESIRSMMQDFSRTLEKSFSLTGLKWRFEAFRTGKKFSEVVLLNTLEYQVEQVFFVHSDTGLPLIHLFHENALHQNDGDQVAAMLTVMQQFVKDSFAEGHLSTLEFGELNIYIVQAPQSYLACVVRGQAPSDLRTDMQIALELMVMECADELDTYEQGGEISRFEKAAHYAERLLSARFKGEGRKLSLRTRLLTVALIAAILAPFAFWGYKYYETRLLEARVSEAVAKAGVVPLKIKTSLFGQWEIVVLQDELADRPSIPLADPDESRHIDGRSGLGGSLSDAALDMPLVERIVASGLPVNRFRLEKQTFVSLDPEIVIERVQSLLTGDGSKGISHSVYQREGGLEVSIAGQGSISWVLPLYERLMAVPGVNSVKVSLNDSENDLVLTIKDGLLNLEGQATLVPWIFSIYERLSNVDRITKVKLKVSDPDNGVVASIENGALRFDGQASLGWQAAASEGAMTVFAGRRVDMSHIQDDGPTKELKMLRDRINQVVIYFPLGKDTPIASDMPTLNQAVDDLVKMKELADSMGVSITLTIYGHADATGSDTRNFELSQARTKTVAAKLYAKGSSIPIYSYGWGAEFAAKNADESKSGDDQDSRKIELRVDIIKKAAVLHE